MAISELLLSAPNIKGTPANKIKVSPIPTETIMFKILEKLFFIFFSPFSKSVPKHINNIAYCAFSEVIIFDVMNIIFYFAFNIYLYAITIFSCIIVSFLSLAIGVFALVSSKLFEMTIEIKDENDKTI